jgi:predicted RNase H-like nuclease (RuvC/YqgF family)
MSKVYQSLRVVVQDTLQRGKANSMPLAPLKTSSALILNDEVEELEKLFVDKIGRFKAGLKENEIVVAGKAKDAEDLIDGLKLNIAALETKLKETEDAGRKKDFALQKMEESLNAKIHNLQNDAKKKEEVLESRANEVNDLKSKIDGQVKQIAELDLAVQNAKMEAASQAKRAEDLTESLKRKIALEAQLKDKEEIVRKKESTIKGLEQNLNAKIEDLESQLRSKKELLASRDAEINDLKSQLKVLTKGIEEMSFFFRKTEALATVEGQGVSTANPNNLLKGGEEKPAIFQSNESKVTPVVPDGAPEIVSGDAFDHMIRELAEVTNVISILASVIVHDHVAALGESMEKFPKTRVPELLESLSHEILDENLKTKFRERLGNAALV